MTLEQSPFDAADMLPDELARRLLARAIELEAVAPAGISLAELREVANEAGISSSALEQALAELRDKSAPAALESVTLPPKRRTPRWVAFSGLLMAGYLAVAFLGRLLP